VEGPGPGSVFGGLGTSGQDGWMTTIAKGRYAYRCDGTETPVDERFEVLPQTRGLLVTSRRSAPGTGLQVDSVFGAGGTIEATLSWTSELAGTAAHAVVVHRWNGSVLAASGQVDGRDAAARLEASDASYFPLMRVFSGRTLLRLMAASADGHDGIDVVTPDIRDPKAVERWLAPLLDHRRIASVQATTLEVDGVERPCHEVEYLGGSYDQAASVWVDEGGLLLRYTWDQPGVGDWDVRLCDVEGDWPRPREW
jgi:hypothetical protein